MLHGYDDLALVISTKPLRYRDITKGFNRAHLVFDDELLCHILKVSLAHLLESVANILLYKLIFFCL